MSDLVRLGGVRMVRLRPLLPKGEDRPGVDGRHAPGGMVFIDRSG